MTIRRQLRLLLHFLKLIPNAKAQHDNPTPPDPTPPENTLTAEIISSDTQGVVPATFQFRAEVSGGRDPYTYSWDFDDGSREESNEQSISHTFENTGTYNVVVTVRDSGDQTALSNPKEINVVVEPPVPPCPEGQVLEDGECVEPPVPPCPEGQVLEDGECVEPPGEGEGELREEPPVNDTG